MVDDRHDKPELEQLRAEVAEWRRRAEVAEALAAERLARVETAERALATAEAALRRLPQEPRAVTPPPPPATAGRETEADAVDRPKSWLERWRRYTDSIT